MSQSAPTLTYEVSVADAEASTWRICRLGRDADGGAHYSLEKLDAEGNVVATHAIDARRLGPGRLHLLAADASHDVGVSDLGDVLSVHVGGHEVEVSAVDPRKKALRTAGGAGGGSVKTQMPGRIVRVLVEPGQEVEKGDALVVVEAMKMENELKSPRAGTVARVAVAEGDVVEARAVLVELS